MTNEPEEIYLVTDSTDATERHPSLRNDEVGQLHATTTNLDDVEDFSHVCRMCATVTEFVIPIFAGEGLQNNLAEKIHKHLPIQVLQEDTLPRVVCCQCASTLLAWHELVQCCVQADAALKSRALILQQSQNALNTDSGAKNEETDQQNGESLYAAVKNALHTQYQKSMSESDEDAAFTCHACPHSTRVASTHSLATHLAVTHCVPAVRVSCFLKEHVALEEYIDCDHSLSPSSEPTLTVSITFPCPHCPSEFTSAARLASHLSQHKEPRPICCTPIVHRSAFLRHLRRDHARKSGDPSACRACQYVAPDVVSLRDHITREHPTPESSGTSRKRAPATCPECGVTFSNKANMLAHARRHVARERHICETCGRVYSSAGNLATHSRTAHSGVLPHRCPHCAEGFATRAARDVHARIHTGARPFACPHCPRAFRARQTLARHVDAHRGVRRHRCHTCDRTFSRYGHLMYHLGTHQRKT